MTELLLELFSEEIPARMQLKGLRNYSEIVRRHLKENNIRFEKIDGFVSPRRVTIHVTDMSKITVTPEVEIKGPRIDSPLPAVEGFCRSNGITYNELSTVTINNQECFIYIKPSRKQKTRELLLDILPKAIRDQVWPKSMRWGNYDMTWIRPLRSILCLFDSEILPVKYGHIEASNLTKGHRFASNADFLQVKNFADYCDQLEKNYVIFDHTRRKASIIRQMAKLGFNKQLAILEDEDLLEEVTGLVDYPNVMMGSISERFMHLPKEVLITSMRMHQKYFSLVYSNGNLAPYFLFVSNIVTDGNLAPYFLFVSNTVSENPDIIVSGNEKVLSARLSDALYFYDQDLKISLESRLKKLEEVVFHAKLGSLKDKTDRLVKICQYLAPDNKALHQAARLCKSDLVSEMVGEFPELQGIMGYHYALSEDLRDEVAGAIKNHYKPEGLADEVPHGNAALLAIADKIDSLVGLMLAGEVSTGSKDPYALRRKAIGIIRITLAEQLELDMKELVNFVASLYIIKSEGVIDKIISFIEDKRKSYFKNKGKND